MPQALLPPSPRQRNRHRFPVTEKQKKTNRQHKSPTHTLHPHASTCISTPGFRYGSGPVRRGHFLSHPSLPQKENHPEYSMFRPYTHTLPTAAPEPWRHTHTTIRNTISTKTSSLLTLIVFQHTILIKKSETSSILNF